MVDPWSETEQETSNELITIRVEIVYVLLFADVPRFPLVAFSDTREHVTTFVIAVQNSKTETDSTE